jgi:hypothetical protein
MPPPGLQPHTTTGATIVETSPGVWRLAIPVGGKGSYRLAQLDDYCAKPRREFAWRPGFFLELQARCSAADLPGTWGFGLWNDPFSMSILSGAGALRLPALPNAAWFFFASPPNHLTLRADLPANGNLGACFQSPLIPPPLLLLGALFLPCILIPPFMRLMRRLGSKIVRQDALALSLDPCQWHTYRLELHADHVCFQVDAGAVFRSTTVPNGPLGLVLWIDNQYAALPPTGRLRYGTLPTPDDAWIELRGLDWGGIEGL